MTNFYLLNGVIFGLGLVNGFVDAIGQVILIGNFVATEGARLVALFHLVFNFGGIVGSLIMDRFIDEGMERPCPADQQEVAPSTRMVLDDNFAYSYSIPALVHIPIAILLYYIYHLRLYEKLQKEKGERMSAAEIQREDEVPSGVRPFIAVLLVVLFATASTQQNFMAYEVVHASCKL